jgi:hypothetical protein
VALPLRTMVKSGALSISGKSFGRGGRGSPTVPIFEALVEIPDLLVSPKSRVARVHRAAVKKALFEEMKFHHLKRIPEHFNRYRQKKYRYARRSDRTRQKKARLGQPDLVRSSRTKKRMVREMEIRHPRMGGQQGVSVVGLLRWPIGFRFGGAAKRGVTPEVMSEEISRFTLREERTVAQHVMNTYVDELNKNLSRRAKRQIRGQLGRLGIKV